MKLVKPVKDHMDLRIQVKTWNWVGFSSPKYLQYVLRARCVVLTDSLEVQAQTWVLPAWQPLRARWYFTVALCWHVIQIHCLHTALENNHCFVRLDIHYVSCKCLAYGLVTGAFLLVLRSWDDECSSDVRKQRRQHCQNVQEPGDAPLTVNGRLPVWVCFKLWTHRVDHQSSFCQDRVALKNQHAAPVPSGA